MCTRQNPKLPYSRKNNSRYGVITSIKLKKDMELANTQASMHACRQGKLQEYVDACLKSEIVPCNV